MHSHLGTISPKHDHYCNRQGSAANTGFSPSALHSSASAPCRISQAVPTEIQNGPEEYAEATVMVYLLPGSGAQREDHVIHGSTTYEVLGVREPSVDNHHTALVCKVQTDGA